MKRTLSILLLLFITLSASATSQIGDLLIWKGEKLKLFSNPLQLRADWNELSKIIYNELYEEDRRINPHKYEADEVEAMWSTGCNRGYVAEWEIINEKIYLINIYSCHDDKVKVDLNKIFAKEINKNKVFAYWVTDNLIVPKGKCIEYVHLGYNSIYETEINLEINKGSLLTTKTYHNYFAKKSNFFTNSNPDEYEDFIYTNINWETLPDVTNKHIQVYVGVLPNKDGKIDRILNDYTYFIENNTIISDSNDPFIKEALRIAALIPDWDVIYQRDAIKSQHISIVFDENRKNKYAH